MESLLIVIDILSALAIIGLVLIQQGKGADMGASFGSGASQTLFGSAGSGNVLTRSTTWLAAVFFAASLGLTVIAKSGAGVTTEEDALLANPAAANTAAPASTALPDLAAGAALEPSSEAVAQPAAVTDATEEAAVVPPATVEQQTETKQN
jgi:preprotein translocase subunit SecG